MTPIFDGFSDVADICANWTGAADHLGEGVELIAAVYDQGSYDGSAFCVWRKDGKLYEASCSHCSCNGLDDFTPEETSAAAMLMRPGLDPKLRLTLVAEYGCTVHEDCAAYPELGRACAGVAEPT